ncbi:MAG: hypothetical protein ABSB67_01475 [Bryobacteraceae bacterium]
MVATEAAATVKPAVDVPARTFTEAGTFTKALFDDNATTDPLAGAGAEIVTVQVELAPETTVAGEHVRFDTAVAVTVSGALAVDAFSEAVSVAI